MSRLSFDAQGKLIGVDGVVVSKKEKSVEKRELKRSSDKELKKVDGSADTEYWSLYRNGKRLDPLLFSNGKTQEDVVQEVVEAIQSGNKMVFLHGMCGTGKSAIALNVARVLGRASIVVPVKNLQKQYEKDYMGEMFVAKNNGVQLEIAMITGRDNHDSLIKSGKSCADPYLPDTIQINEKNFGKLKEYYDNNPLIKNRHEFIDVKKLRRISVAPTNPYWSPIIPVEYEVQLSDAVKKRYLGLNGKEFIFYHRKRGCSYYDQYQSYINSDVIIFNSAKYKIEVGMDRKPATKVDIIDEADEFLDSFSNQIELNLTRLERALRNIVSDDGDVNSILDTIRELISLEEKRVRAIGINEDEIIHVKETNIGKILGLFLKDRNIESEISLDDSNYGNKAVEAAKDFAEFLNDTYLTYRKHEDNLLVNLVTTDLSKRLGEVIDKNESFVFMSGTLHSREVLEKVFGIKDYVVINAETSHQGEIEIFRTGKEKNCSYRNFRNGDVNRQDYLVALASCVKWAEKPFLVHVNAFDDLPSAIEIGKFSLGSLMSREQLFDLQTKDKVGRLVEIFKQGLNDALYSTKCSRGVDFPGEICKAMIFTKFPNPNVRGTFWKVLEKTHPDYYWDFYKDKAQRGFLQRLYRALRSKDDHVYVLSPDSRVLDAVRNLQLARQGV
jgi:Rad3-related DNA helicase